jgi:hypothetical protein
MKLLALIILLTGLSACKTQNNAPVENPLVGKWEWVRSKGGLAGTTVSSSPADQKQVIFTREGDHELIENGKSKMKVEYVIRNGKSMLSMSHVPMVYFRSNKIYQSFRVESDTLFLTDEIYDGFSHVYLRVSE